MDSGLTWHEEEWPIENLKKFDRNPRTISKEQFKILKEGIRKVGYHHPIAIQPDGGIISGHQRAKALRDLGYKTIRVSVPSRELTEDEFRQMLVQANINNGEFDYNILTEDYSLDELVDFGMSEKELRGFYEEENSGLTDPDAVPDLLAEVVCQVGDVWILGNHRLMCGDSTKAEDVAKLLGAVKPHLCITDPPYGVEYDANWRNETDRANGKPIGARAVGKVHNDDKVDWREAWALFPGNIMYVWHAGKMAGEVQASLEACDFEIRSQIIWAKNNFAISRGDYHWQHEPCWYAVKGTGKWTGDRKQTTLWLIDKPQKSETGHSTQKPVECMKRPIENNSSPGQVVYEPFSGSGTTIVAAETTGRSCFAMEIFPAYVDLAVRRWQNFSGKKAINETTGESFPG